MLNTVLTVSQGKPGSHADFGWEIFTDKIISLLNSSSHNPMIFLLWGAAAKAKKKLISNHPILEASHPSPLGVHKGFKGCKHFSQANLYLEVNNLKPIDWSL